MNVSSGSLYLCHVISTPSKSDTRLGALTISQNRVASQTGIF